MSVKLLGATIIGLRGFSFKRGISKEHLYAAGDDPIDIQSGEKKPEGSLKLLKFELDKLNDAAQAAGFEDITQVPHPLITITCRFKKFETSRARITEAFGVSFLEYEEAMNQGEKFMEVTLPFLAMKVTARAL